MDLTDACTAANLFYEGTHRVGDRGADTIAAKGRRTHLRCGTTGGHRRHHQPPGDPRRRRGGARRGRGHPAALTAPTTTSSVRRHPRRQRRPHLHLPRRPCQWLRPRRLLYPGGDESQGGTPGLQGQYLELTSRRQAPQPHAGLHGAPRMPGLCWLCLPGVCCLCLRRPFRSTYRHRSPGSMAQAPDAGGSRLAVGPSLPSAWVPEQVILNLVAPRPTAMVPHIGPTFLRGGGRSGPRSRRPWKRRTRRTPRGPSTTMRPCWLLAPGARSTRGSSFGSRWRRATAWSRGP